MLRTAQRTRLGRLLLLLVALSWLSCPALADVWGYLDDKGLPHFASERLDERYELFFRSNTVAARQAEDRAAAAPAVPVFPRQVGVPSVSPRLLAFFEMSASFKGVRHWLREASAAHNIDMELLQALIVTESGFDSQAVSPKGAVGLMQIMPATAERYGVVSDARTPVEKKLTDPQTNIKTGTRYLRYLLNLFPGQLELALAAYNAGEGAVQRAGNNIPRYKETQDYVKTVMQLYTMLKPPAVVADLRRASSTSGGRVRVELPGLPGAAAVAGGALGRANMIMPLAALPAMPTVAIGSPSTRSAELDFEP